MGGDLLLVTNGWIMNKFFTAAVVVVIFTSSIILPCFESEDNISANYLSKMFGDIDDGRENGSEFDDPNYRWFVDDRSSLTQDNDFFRSLELSDSFRTSGNDLFIELNEQNNQGRPVQNKIEIERGRLSSQLGVSKVRVLRSRNQVWMQIGRESALADILRNKKALDLTKEQIEMLDILLSDESERSKLSESEAQ